MIGCWNSRNGPLLLARVPNERNHCTGRRGWCGGGHWYGPPRGPAPQCLARRPCATWQEARVGGGSRPPGRGFWVTETTRGARRLKDEKSPTYSRDPWRLLLEGRTVLVYGCIPVAQHREVYEGVHEVETIFIILRDTAFLFLSLSSV
ncbi:uncharacterized protein LOC135228494 isoform X4 [Loxodonta africana]|uniref:uncharacterized protein LOC135228494 isoform X4 n=1 Tax=Loxodonta africana TaxID=9785 RepID=UPI0030CD0BE8